MTNCNFENDIVFEIIDSLGVISTAATGWTKELNLIRWNGGIPKYDIREWSPDHDRMSRGITLKESEMSAIVDLFSGYEFMKKNEK